MVTFNNFDEWWDADALTWTNPYPEDSPVYWAWEGWIAGIRSDREACANTLNLTRSDALLMTGEMTAQEWRTVVAVLKALQSRMLGTQGEIK